MRVYIGLGSQILEDALLSLLQHAEPDIEFIPLPHGIATLPHEPSVILCDIMVLKQLPEIERGNPLKLIIFDSGQSKEQILVLLLSHPIDGVIAADSDLAMLVKALRVVHGGQVWVDNSLLKLLLQQAETQNYSHREQLSRKERDIVVLISQGCRNRDIANRLSISEQTVKTHLSRIFRKLNVSTRTQLIPFGMKYWNES